MQIDNLLLKYPELKKDIEPEKYTINVLRGLKTRIEQQPELYKYIKSFKFEKLFFVWHIIQNKKYIMALNSDNNLLDTENKYLYISQNELCIRDSGKYLNLLVSHDILERQYRLSVNDRPIRYHRIADKYLKYASDKYILKDKRVIKTLKNARLKYLKSIVNYPDLLQAFISYSKMELPDREALTARARELHKAGYSKNGKKFKLLESVTERHARRIKAEYKDKKNIHIADVYIDRVCYLKENPHLMMLPKFSHPVMSMLKDIDKHGGKRINKRIYTAFNLMPSWIRSLIKIDGQECIELDASALHLAELNTLIDDKSEKIKFEKACKIDGGMHTYITNRYNAINGTDKTRDEIKKSGLYCINEKLNKMPRYPLYSVFETDFPKTLNKIIEIKKVDYKALNKILETHEARLINAVLCDVAHPVFDGVMIKKSDIDKYRSLLNTQALKLDIPTTFNIK